MYLVCDDRRAFRERLVELVASTDESAQVDLAATAEDVLMCCRSRQPDLVVLGTQRAVRNGVEMLRQLRQAQPSAPVVVVAARDDHDIVRLALAANAVGTLRWSDVAADRSSQAYHGAKAALGLMGATARARRHQGGAAADAAPDKSQNRSSALPNLSERENQVLVGMSRGMSNPSIGARLYLSEDTVKTHARRLFRKLGVVDRASAVAVGFRSGLLE